jgi:hypothetical protein
MRCSRIRSSLGRVLLARASQASLCLLTALVAACATPSRPAAMRGAAREPSDVASIGSLAERLSRRLRLPILIDPGVDRSRTIAAPAAGLTAETLAAAIGCHVVREPGAVFLLTEPDPSSEAAGGPSARPATLVVEGTFDGADDASLGVIGAGRLTVIALPDGAERVELLRLLSTLREGDPLRATCRVVAGPDGQDRPVLRSLEFPAR